MFSVQQKKFGKKIYAQKILGIEILGPKNFLVKKGFVKQFFGSTKL